MKYLFIGGIKDGEKIEVADDQNYWRIIEQEDFSFDKWKSYDVGTFVINYKEHVYIKHSFNGANGKIYAFVYTGVSDVMETLMAGYRKGKRKRKKKFSLY